MRASRSALSRLASAALLAAFGSSGVSAGELQITWGSEALRLEALPATLPVSARTSLESWAPFAQRLELRFDLDRDARVWLVGPAGEAAATGRRKLAERAATAWSALVPTFREAAPPPEAAGGSEPKGGKAGKPKPEDPIPEDPEGAFPWLEPKGGGETGSTPPTEATWGDSLWPPDGDTAVLFVLPDDAALAALLDELGAKYPDLAAWTVEAKKDAGFVVEAPLVGAFLLGGEDLEEWSPDNELVHRVARLLTLRRWGQLPPWLAYGIAWNVEQETMRSIRSFPNRHEFVGVGESSAWEGDLQRRFAALRDEPLAVDTFAGWPRGQWDGPRARVAWALVRFLAKHRSGAEDVGAGGGFGAFLAELRASWRRDNRTGLGEGVWTRDRTWEVPAARQGELLLSTCGDDVLVEAGRALRLGSDYRTPRRRPGAKR